MVVPSAPNSSSRTSASGSRGSWLQQSTSGLVGLGFVAESVSGSWEVGLGPSHARHKSGFACELQAAASDLSDLRMLTGGKACPLFGVGKKT